MGSGAPGPGDVEWLDGEEQPHGRVRQVLQRRLATRGGRALLALLTTAAVAVAVTGAVVAWPDESSPPAAAGADEPEPPARSDLTVTPQRHHEGREPVVRWQLVREFDDSVPTAPRFRLVNRTIQPQQPTKIHVRGKFRGAPGLAFHAKCQGSGQARERMVAPGDKVDVVCRDVTDYRGQQGAAQPRLDRSSLRIAPTMVPCGSGHRGGF